VAPVTDVPLIPIDFLAFLRHGKNFRAAFLLHTSRKEIIMTKEEIQNKYFPGEEILWFGTPDKLRYFMREDWVMIPLTLLVGGYLLFFAFASMITMFRGESMTFALSGITFLLIGFYLIFGRIWYRHKRLSKNMYFITNKRVFIFNTLRNQIAVDILLDFTNPYQLQNTIFLAEKSLLGDIAYSLGLDVFFHNTLSASPAFIAISNPEQVLKKLTLAKKNRKKANHDTDDFI
jgi:hypothetical protein